MRRSVLKQGERVRAGVCLPALSLLSIAVLGVAVSGCGSGSSSSSTPVPVSPVSAPAGAGGSSTDAVALVSGTPIPKASYRHWLAVERALGASSSPSHQALGFLITSEWVIEEAAARKISVSEAEVRKRYDQLVRQSFPKSGSLKKYLSKSGETEADLLARIRVELLASKIGAEVTKGKGSSQRSTILSAFEKGFHSHWKNLTSCHAGYMMEDCRQYHGKPEDLTATSTGSASGSKASPSSSSAGGEVYTAPGAFSVSSPDFARNEPIPAQYTCDGAGISPALEWQKVPAGAAELVLFVIDDTSSTKSGGIRWIVGGIDPSSTGVAAGKVPAGGILGTNTAGKVGYSPICPGHGKTDTIEFVMYALKKKIPISTGFQPSEAESDYGSHKLILGQAAVDYAVYQRR
jgi:phosphatidylethanolamine-binding protein (PEBP) family uncharacterized protein